MHQWTGTVKEMARRIDFTGLIHYIIVREMDKKLAAREEEMLSELFDGDGSATTTESTSISLLSESAPLLSSSLSTPRESFVSTEMLCELKSEIANPEVL